MTLAEPLHGPAARLMLLARPDASSAAYPRASSFPFLACCTFAPPPLTYGPMRPTAPPMSARLATTESSNSIPAFSTNAPVVITHVHAQAIVVRPNIKEFGETSVVYEDGQEFPCDAVVFATGYTVRVPPSRRARTPV